MTHGIVQLSSSVTLVIDDRLKALITAQFDQVSRQPRTAYFHIGFLHGLYRLPNVTSRKK